MKNNHETVQQVFVDFPSGNSTVFSVGGLYIHNGNEYAIREIRVDENEVAIYAVPCGLVSTSMPTPVLVRRYIGAPFCIKYS